MGAFLRAELAAGRGYLPAGDHVLRAFERPLADVRVLIVGPGPYPTPGHPIGLSFAVAPDVRPCRGPWRNIYKELETDLGIAPVAHGDLSAVGRPGRDAAQPGAHRAGRATAASHRGRGLGGHHRVRDHRAGRPRRTVRGDPVGHATRSRSSPCSAPIPWVESVHPSPLSASRGFFGSRPFSPGEQAARRPGRGPDRLVAAASLTIS